jgi:hypothetical protein
MASLIHRLFAVCGVFCCATLLFSEPGMAQPFFTDVSEEIGLPLLPTRGTAFGDYNNDGRPDLLVAESAFEDNPQIELLANEGTGRFADHTAVIQADVSPPTTGGGQLFGDYDNDGDLDLFIPIGFGGAQVNMLLRNDRGVFRDVTLEAGLTTRARSDNAIWLDYDRDGFIDLYVGNIDEPSNRLYRNNGDGTFLDVTEALGLHHVFQADFGGGSNGGLSGGDFNDDGWPDIYLGVFLDRNRLFLSDGQGGFDDATTDEIGDPGEAFGLAVGDIDHDLHLDLFQAAGGSQGKFRSLMFLNLGAGQLLDVTEGVLGRTVLNESNVLGAGLADIDNDGDLDLVVGMPALLFLNNGKGVFVDETAQSGVVHESWTLSFGDYDLDGFLDMWLGGNSSSDGHFYRNNGNGNHWLRVELAGVASNRNGIGARLIATSEDLRQMREILGGLGYYQDEMVAHFGLGGHSRVDSLEIHWPSGQVDVLKDIAADQKIRVIEGRGDYHVVRPTSWEHPPPWQRDQRAL